MKIIIIILLFLVQQNLALTSLMLVKGYTGSTIYNENSVPLPNVFGIDMCAHSFHKHTIMHGNASSWMGFYLDFLHRCNMLTSIPFFVVSKSASSNMPIYLDKTSLLYVMADEPSVKIEYFARQSDGTKLFYEHVLVGTTRSNFSIPSPRISSIQNLTKFIEGDYAFTSVFGGNAYFCLIVPKVCYMKPIGAPSYLFQELPLDGLININEKTAVSYKQGEIWFFGGFARYNQIDIFCNGKVFDGPTALPGTGLQRHAAVFFSNKILLTGGTTGDIPEQFNRKTYVYDVDASMWTTLANTLPINLYDAALAIWIKSEDEQLPIIFGGYKTYPTAYNLETFSLNVSTGQWTAEPDLYMSQLKGSFINPTVQMVNGVVFAIGSDIGETKRSHAVLYLEKFAKIWKVLGVAEKMTGSLASLPFMAYALPPPKYFNTNP